MKKYKYTFWKKHEKNWTEEIKIDANSLEEAEDILHSGQGKSSILYEQHHIITNDGYYEEEVA